jgi:hypothetical protein
MAAASASMFSARQLGLLAAMGYSLYCRRTESATAPVLANATDPGDPGDAARALPGEPDAAVMRAVLRVIGRDPGSDAGRVAGIWNELALPSPDSLRSAAGKRALWPTLRRLRRAMESP